VASQKRMFIAAAGALAATMALAACGSDDYGLTNAQSAAIGAAPAVAGANAEATEPVPAAEAAGDVAEAAEDAADADDEEAADELPIPKVVAKPVGKVTDKLIAKTVPRMGNVVTDAKGWVLYRFDKDKAAPSKSNCVGDCAKLWPPLLAGETLELSGLSASKVDTVEREDGGIQITIGGWPVYRYIGDKTPGTWKGQNVGGTWFVVDKTGKKNLTCLPKISKPVPLPADPADKAKKPKKAKKVAAVTAPDDNADAGYDSGY
jgi:predicted lipoprotein with Yx(FWY)xxD motif